MAGDPAEVMLRLVQDRDRIAEGMNDIVVTRLYSAGLSLETALGLMDDHPGAGQVQNALGKLDLAIQDFRSAVFDHHQPDSANGGQPLQGVRPGRRTYTTEPVRYPI
jgi:signal transduction histidine kinase